MACTNAGADFDQDGTCQPTTCSELNYDCDGGDARTCGTRMVPCLLCIAPDDGGTGSGSGSSSRASSSSSSGPLSTACAALETCCPSLPDASVSMCESLALSNVTYTCQENLKESQAVGLCLGPDAGSDAGKSSSAHHGSSSGGSGKKNGSSTGNGGGGSSLAGSGKGASSTGNGSAGGCATSPRDWNAPDGVLFASVGALIAFAGKRRKRSG
jgi:hypothetical protein